MNSFLGAMILFQMTVQQIHAPGELYLKNVKTIIQPLFMVISTKSKRKHLEKMMMGKRKKVSGQIDAQKQKISAVLLLTKKLV